MSTRAQDSGSTSGVSFEIVWSIGVCCGPSAVQLSLPGDGESPFLTAAHVTDVKALFVADPFMVRQGATWHLFFEVFNSLTERGEIGLATSADTRRWDYQGIVLREPFHLSYPHVFSCDDQWFMIPESAAAGDLRLYRAEAFPHQWRLVKQLLQGDLADHHVFKQEDTWWLLVGGDHLGHSSLRLFFADVLTGPWIEHPSSPIVRNNARIARPAGRAVVRGNRIIRFAQDCDPTYGWQVNAFEIDRLNKLEYHERLLPGGPVLRAGRGWRAHGMHHIDPHEVSPGRWIACVDGYRKEMVVRISY